MSNATKQSIVILAVLLVGSFGFAGYALLEKQKSDSQRIALQNDIKTYQAQSEKYSSDNKALQAQLKKIEEEKNRVQQDLAAATEQMQKFDEEIKKIMAERDEWKGRVDAIQKERDALAEKAKQVAEPKIVYKYIEREGEEKKAGSAEAPVTSPAPKVPTENMTDDYWAQVLKEKAVIELQLEKVKKELSNAAVEIGDLKKSNSDLDLELSKVKSEKEAFEREIKYNKDLADTLSLELARAKGDRKFSLDRSEKIKKENDQLRGQVKELMSTKSALEKTIVKLTDAKVELEKKVTETEGLIQNKIAEVWEIKDSLNKRMQEAADAKLANEIELPPIIVNANPNDLPGKRAAKDSAQTTGLSGSVISVNEENNFVIVDKGQGAGVSVGNKLNIYRGADFIAQVEVIQSRADICAADIKQQKTGIKVGDSVR
ncbi:MAG: hypothetical protein A2787_03050 [Omnitrophica WOR_2 bacterium RIFCSPHIGHO2_01_FULL_48_9]|nr:MAG: hypothetical protein A3D10_04345 [Omnitrophica WOR_2 bacterium RIFCSPHIGHO2_02_FULL_48_11]OGX34229.1 MAG: hypothetical protein A2787_03050 [Omnitrophica WOR_2 bacterium RIFCSPHIGHO2_01_FULL_48_9]